jgi:hypothetical protein
MTCNSYAKSEDKMETKCLIQTTQDKMGVVVHIHNSRTKKADAGVS